jgi:hypothetical protein
MVDRRGEDLPRLVEVAAGIEHSLDLGAVLGPLLDLLVAVVSNQRLVGFFVGHKPDTIVTRQPRCLFGRRKYR